MPAEIATTSSMVNTLTRGLAVLAFLNRLSSATAAELQESLQIPRASVYRILATLMREGFVYKHASGDRYRIAPRVALLSAGLTDGQHLPSLMRPLMEQVTQKLRWPVSFCTLVGAGLVVQENTDHESPLAADRFRVGYRIPVLSSASGLCILAHMNRTLFKQTLKELAREGLEPLPDAGARMELERQLMTIRKQGFSVYHRRRHRTEASTISVPVVIPGTRVPAALTIRYAKTAVATSTAIRDFVPVLKDAAAGVAAAHR